MKKLNPTDATLNFLTKQRKSPFRNLAVYVSQIGRMSVKLTALFLLLIVSQWFLAPTVFAIEEICGSCGHRVSVSGDFKHFKANASDKIEGGSGDVSAFYEEINGNEFSISVLNLPVGKYTISIGEIEFFMEGPDKRVFNVICGDVTLADHFDIYRAAGGMRKICYITGEVEHTGDELRGPVKVVFKAVKETAKFNTFEIKDSSGVSIFKFNASEIAEPFTGDAARIPDISDPAIWRDSDKPLKQRADDLIRRMSLAEKVAQLQNDAPAIKRLGLSAYNYWNEALHGVANNGIATVFPEPVGMASTWNPQLLHREGTVIGIEGRAKFNEYALKNNGDSKWWTGLTFWTPNINIFRDPRWGRGQETYGEDPYLTGEIAVEFIKGLQGDNPKYMLAMACAKHYAVHSGLERERHRFNAEPSERDLYETYLPQFERAVRDGGVAGVMSAYNALNGIPCSASSFLLDDLLRKQWGFEGYVVSDCGGIGDISGKRAHHYVDTQEEAAALAVKAGVNLCCGGEYNALVKAVQQGLLGEKEINEALYYTLWTRFRLGLFDPSEKVPYSKYTIADNDTPEHGQVALEVARQSLVLLKNNGILPLDRSKYKRIAVIGPNGNSKSMLEGNYHGSASHPVSILDGIKQVAGANIEVTFAQGSPVTTKPGTAAWSRQDNETKRPLEELSEEALSHAANADLIIYVGGITPAQEGEGFDRDSIELPEVQEKLVRALHATGKPMVMVNCSGSAIALLWEAENLPAILQAWYPGQEGGRAVAEVLFGQVNPSGHLPLTFYRATTDLPAFTDYSMSNRTYRYFSGKPLYAFGHGLSYTQYEYLNGKLEFAKIRSDGTAKVSVTLKNAGAMDGDDVVQIYYRHVKSSVEQPKLALCGFARVNVKAGQSNQVTVEVPAARLRYWDTRKKQYVVEPGDYEFLIGAASDDIRLKLPMTITAP
jgi:beta-glucosidase